MIGPRCSLVPRLSSISVFPPCARGAFYDEIEKQQPHRLFQHRAKIQCLVSRLSAELCAPVWGAEIMYDDEVLHLAMEGSEHYALGYDPPIYVARTCDDLTAERGFLPKSSHPATQICVAMRERGANPALWWRKVIGQAKLFSHSPCVTSGAVRSTEIADSLW